MSDDRGTDIITCDVKRIAYDGNRFNFDTPGRVELELVIRSGVGGEYARLATHKRSYTLDLFAGPARRLSIKLHNAAIRFKESFKGTISTMEENNHYGITMHTLANGPITVVVDWQQKTGWLLVKVNGALVGQWTMTQRASASPVNTLQISGTTYTGNYGSTQMNWQDTALDLGSGWKWLWWFGYYVDTQNNGWVWHKEYGWLYSTADSAWDCWMYSPTLGWFWTRSGSFPWVCKAGGEWINLAAQPDTMPRLAIDRYNFVAGGRVIKPLIYTAWSLMEGSDADIAYFIQKVAALGFNAIQFGATSSGGRAFSANGTPNEAWWNRVETVLEVMRQHGIYGMPLVGLILAYGSDGKPSKVLANSLAEHVGRWIADRLLHVTNVGSYIIEGLDSGYTPAVLRAIAGGIRSRDTDALITYHPAHGAQSNDVIPMGNLHQWVYAQSGHRDKSLDTIRALFARRLTSAPWIDAEYRYEDLAWYGGGGRITAEDCAAAARCHRSIGANGGSFGNIFTALLSAGWREYLDHPGAARVVAEWKGA